MFRYGCLADKTIEPPLGRIDLIDTLPWITPIQLCRAIDNGNIRTFLNIEIEGIIMANDS